MSKIQIPRKYLFYSCLSVCFFGFVFVFHTWNNWHNTAKQGKHSSQNINSRQETANGGSIVSKSVNEDILKSYFNPRVSNSHGSTNEGNAADNKEEEDTLDGFKLCFYPTFREKILNDANINVENIRIGNNDKSGNETEKEKSKNMMFNVLAKFSNLSRCLNIKPVLIDPFILYCTLPSYLKEKLTQRRFSLDASKINPHLVTLAMFQKDAVNLEKEDSLNLVKETGFQVEFIKRIRPKWMENSTLSSSLITSHVFLTFQSYTLHAVVFYERNNYLWHSSLVFEEPQYSSHNASFYFVHYDAAFENITVAPIGLRYKLLEELHLPTKPAEFLYEIGSSRFLECDSNIVEQYLKLNKTGIDMKHSRFSTQDFNSILIKALQELKSIFTPLLMQLFIWSGTMLGWYRQCDVIPYTGDVDFGAWSAEVDDLEDLEKVFRKNESLKISQRMGLANNGLEFNLNYERLRVDVFFLQPESNGTWYAGHRPSKGYFFKYHHPNFSLCSAELLQHKVLVPCETEEVIATEYGKDWLHPVSSWNYERSIWNRGPNIYWNTTMLEKVYANY